MIRRTSIIAAGSISIVLSPVVSAERFAGELEELVVQDADDSVLPAYFAGSASVIDEEEIAKSGARSIVDLLESQGGIRFTSTSGNSAGGEIHMRGFGENSASRVLVLIDGRRVNRPDMASVSWLAVPLGRISKVEILRGSQTARFGDNAVGGVINIITKDGKKTATLVEAAGGSDGYSMSRISHQDTIEGHSFSFDLERNLTDGWRRNSASELEAISLRWRTDLSQGIEASFGISWTEEFTGFPGPLSRQRYLQDPRQSIYALAGQADQYFSKQEAWIIDGALSYRPSGDRSFELPVTFLRRDLEWNFGPGFHTDNTLDSVSISPVWKFSGERWVAEFGMPYRHETLDLSQFSEIARVNQTSEAALARDVIGAYAAGQWEPHEGLHVDLSGRIERSEMNASSSSFISPNNPALNFSRSTAETNYAWQAGVRWEPSADTSLWIRYDRLYRLPSTDEIASYQGFPLTVPFNDQLQSETGDNIELGAEWTPDAWTFRLNGFAQLLEGEIAYDFTRNLNVNLADTRRIGIESSIGYEAGIWSANLHGSILSAEYESGPYAGRDVYLVPNQELTATLVCRPHEHLTFQAEYRYSGSSYEGNDFLNNQPKLPSYGVTNFLVRYEPKPDLSLYLRMNNLFDAHYATVKYSGVWYPAAGQQFQLGIRREF